MEWLRLGFHEAMYTEEDISEAYAQRRGRTSRQRATATMDWSAQALELALAFIVDMEHDETPFVTRQKDMFVIHLRQALDAANLALSISEGRNRGVVRCVPLHPAEPSPQVRDDVAAAPWCAPLLRPAIHVLPQPSSTPHDTAVLHADAVRTD